MDIEMNSMGTAQEIFKILLKILVCMSMAQEMHRRWVVWLLLMKAHRNKVLYMNYYYTFF
jgi:hypothetical protein